MSELTNLNETLQSKPARAIEIDQLNEQAWNLRHKEYERATKLSQYAFELSTTGAFAEEHYSEGKAASLTTQAFLNQQTGKFELAISQCLQVTHLLEGKAPTRVTVDAWRISSMISFFVGELTSALEHGLRALRLARELRLEEQEASTLDGLGMIYSVSGDKAQAASSHQAAYQLAKKLGNQTLESVVLNNWANFYVRDGQIEKALEIAQQSLEIARRITLGNHLINVMDTLGNVYSQMGQTKEAQLILQEALELAIRSDSGIGQVYCLSNLGKLYLTQNEYDKAQAHLEQALQIASRISMQQVEAECHLALSDLFERKGQLQQALFHHKSYFPLKEKISNDVSAQRQAILRITHEVETARRDAEIYRLRNVDLQNEINERTRIETALRESEEKFKKQYKGLPLPTFTWQDTGDNFILVDYNDSAYEFTRGKIANWIGQTASSVYKDQPETVFEIAECGRTKSNLRRERWHRLVSTGENKYLQLNYAFVPPDLVMIHTDDFTERKRSDDTLKSTTRQLSALLQYMQSGILFEDHSRHIALANQIFCELFSINMPASELVGVSCLSSLEKSKALMADPDGFIDRIEAIIENQVLVTNEELHLADGRVFERDYIPIPLEGQQPGHLWQYRDVSARKQAEEKLREEEQKYRDLVEGSPDAIAIHAEGRIIFANTASVELMRAASADELLGYPIMEMVHPDYREFVSQRMKAAQNDKTPPSWVEEKFIRLDGSTVDVAVKAIPITFEKRPATQIIVLDITQRKQAEDALRESEERFRMLLQNVPTVSVQGYSMDGTTQYWNEASEKLYGYTAQEAIGKNLLDLIIPAEMRNDVRKAISSMAETGQVIPASELTLNRKDGSLVTVFSSHAIVKRVGKTPELFCIDIDLSARKQAETEIAKMALALNVAPNAITVHDEEGRILYANQRAFELHGYEREEFMALNFKDLATPGSARFIDERMRELKDRGEVTYQVEHRRKQGVDLPVEVYLRATKWGDVNAILSIATDISERKQREYELHAIASLSATLRTAPNRAEMLPVIVEWLSDLLQCDSISAEMIEPLSGDVIVEAASGDWASFIGSRQPAGTGLNAVITETRKPYRHNAIEDDPRFNIPGYFVKRTLKGAGLPLIAQDQLIGFLWVNREKFFTESEFRLLGSVTDIAANALYRSTLHEQTQQDAADLAEAYDTTLEGWAHALELRDQETEGHTRRVVQKTIELAQAFGFGKTELENLRRGALLHDIGKMGIPDSVLLKPGTLNEREWEIMRRHPEYAYQLLKPIDYLRPVLDIPACHHEKWDGSGYPQGLKGEQIPLAARIFAIVDVWDALTSDRPYRTAWMPEKVIDYIIEQSGKHFDPRVVQVFLDQLEYNQLSD